MNIIDSKTGILLNVGCGTRHHADWTNIDFKSEGVDVIGHDLLKGIPFPDESFDVVYHSHLLEHFSEIDGKKLMQECYRVLKLGGIIRIAVPDLEAIVNEYKKYLDLSLQGAEGAAFNYDWIMLELYDQAVRTAGGGEMGKFLTQDTVPNESFVRSRMGYFYDVVRRSLTGAPTTTFIARMKEKMKHVAWIKNFHEKIKELKEKHRSYRSLGKFRMSGEMHLRMYDRFSLSRLLREQGFKNPEVCGAAASSIRDWTSYNLDTQPNGEVYKPDSLFMEAVK